MVVGGEEMTHMVFKRRKTWGSMAKLWKENMIFREVKREFYERVMIPTLVYGSETWS